MFVKLGRNRALKKKISRALDHADLPVFKGTISNALILLDNPSDELQAAFKELYLGLGVKSDQVHFLKFIDKLPKNEERPLDVITPMQFNAKGKVVGLFNPYHPDTHYDLVIAAYDMPHLFLNALVIDQPHAFKVGLIANEEQLFHLRVDLKVNQTDGFIAEILRYLRILKHL